MSTDRSPTRWCLTTLLLAATALASCTGCNGRSSYLDATGAAGASEAALGRWLTLVACLVVAIVCVAILAGIARHRGERAAAEGDARRRELGSGLSWIWVGLAATVVVLVATFAGTMATLDAASHPPAAPSPSAPSLTMDVTGHQWWWEVTYSEAGHPDFAFTTANEVHLPVGVPVRVRLHAADVIHSFWLPQIAGKTDLIPGQVNETWVEARRAGTSRGMCGEYCGLQHAVMAMPVTAEPPAAFALWAAARRGAAVTPGAGEGEARVGMTVFTRSCGACHTVAGTNALGRVGPDLTHVASRPTIGAGALDNTPANLARWITDAPRVKEGARMPAIPLDAAALRAVVAYLGTLR